MQTFGIRLENVGSVLSTVGCRAMLLVVYNFLVLCFYVQASSNCSKCVGALSVIRRLRDKHVVSGNITISVL